MRRLEVKKTYKLYIGGKFPRSESGRTHALLDKKGALIANIAMASKKDLRSTVVAARKAQLGWQGASPYLKGQILYRLAEMLEGRKSQFVSVLKQSGMSEKAALTEVEKSVDALVYFAGWSDKFQAVYSSVNPVSSPHYNFSAPVPTGLVGIVLDDKAGLYGLVSQMAPVIVGGNSNLLVVPSKWATVAMELAEVIHTSDVPCGVVNILTGDISDMLPTLSGHMDVNAVALCSSDKALRKSVRELGAENVKRTIFHDTSKGKLSPYPIMDFQEIKTTWHPVD
ncbi:MAG: acyl-CoA reductase-like NAD-dependent aldehyde dehydrogenase [Cryomorphaceae bacterium]|jgi:acyl-CoA reductase-like NAD-dependent aldehyde dehydrogenase